MKICVFGCKNTSILLCEKLTALGRPFSLVTISPNKGRDQEVAGYTDLKSLDLGPETIHVARKYSLQSDFDTEYFIENKFDLGFVMGWQRLVPKAILDAFSIGVFGMHGSAQDLPFGRGRSPMNWSILEGRDWFYTNLFRYNAGVDDGPILDTSCFSIQPGDTAETMHYKNTVSMLSLVERNLERLATGEFSLKLQDEGAGSYYVKRTPADGLIDWAAPLVNIERLIRAVAPPFNGAFSYLDNKQVVFETAAIFFTDLELHPYKGSAVGEVCEVFPNGKFLVRCNGGVLLIHKFSCGADVSITKGRLFESDTSNMKRFARNIYGNFDILE